MKPFYSVFFLLFFLISCKIKEDPTPAVEVPEIYCTLSQFIQKSETKDEKGFIWQTNTYTSNFYEKDTTVRDDFSESIYKIVYDKDGYILKSTTQNRFTPFTSDFFLLESIFIYSNTKLIEIQKSSGSSKTGKVDKSSEKFEYDRNGKLSKHINTFIEGTQIIRGFVNGVQKSYIIRSSDGMENDISNQYNANGFIVTEKIGTNFENRYFYDSNGNLEKTESWEKGELKSYKQNEYGSFKNKQHLARPLRKSYPFIPSTTGNYSYWKTKTKAFSLGASNNKLYLSSESNYTYKFNKDGLVIEDIGITDNYYETGLFLNKQIQTANYTYTGCR